MLVLPVCTEVLVMILSRTVRALIMFILHAIDYETLFWVLITWAKCNAQGWNCLCFISHSDSSLNSKSQQSCHFCRSDEKELAAIFSCFSLSLKVIEDFQHYYVLKLEVVLGKKVDSRNQRVVFPAPRKMLAGFLHGVCKSFCLLLLKMLTSLSFDLCYMQWVQSPRNSHFIVSTLCLNLTHFVGNHCSLSLALRS